MIRYTELGVWVSIALNSWNYDHLEIAFFMDEGEGNIDLVGKDSNSYGSFCGFDYTEPVGQLTDFMEEDEG